MSLIWMSLARRLCTLPSLLLPLLMTSQLLAAQSAQADALTLEQWRAKRVANLTSESGWLTLVGLYWLKQGDNTFGRAKTNRLVLDHPALPTTAGTLTLSDKTVTFTSAPSAPVLHDQTRVSTIAMSPDTSGDATTLAIGSLRFYVIERGGKLGIRVRDVEHPARKQFHGIDYFPPSDDWIVDARFEPYPAGKQIPIINILGMKEPMATPGAIVFNRDGHEWRLDALLEAPDDDELFIMFADTTSARETYGAGRFLYIPKPQDGRVKVDFNRAYNPPCAFNEFATCPLPPPQNRLKLPVTAGEKKYVAHH